MARLAGLEPTASASAGLRSIHLSYKRIRYDGAEGGIRRALSRSVFLGVVTASRVEVASSHHPILPHASLCQQVCVLGQGISDNSPSFLV